MVVVKSKKELKEAIKSHKDEIHVEGKLVKPLKIIAKLQKKNKFKGKDGSKVTTAHMTGALSAVGVSLAIALSTIATIGIVSIVAILNGYDIDCESKHLKLKTKKSS